MDTGSSGWRVSGTVWCFSSCDPRVCASGRFARFGRIHPSGQNLVAASKVILKPESDLQGRRARGTENQGVQANSCAEADTADLILLIQHIPHVGCRVDLGSRNIVPFDQAVSTGALEIVSAIRDITERSRAEEALRQAQGDLARINRVTTTGELAASLAHELSQPISGATINANTALRKLERDDLDPGELRAVVTRFARDAQRTSDIIGRIRPLFARGTSNREVIDVNEVNQEIVTLLRDEAVRYNVLVRTELAADLPRIVGDRVHLQQVAMNLIVNGIEAMRDVDGTREIVIKSQRAEDEQILVSVSDTGRGFSPQLAEQIFDPFFTTKPQGTGMGLRICRSMASSLSDWPVPHKPQIACAFGP
jgi:C4-dicarboxylate-specific signal transduction histidine kinase